MVDKSLLTVLFFVGYVFLGAYQAKISSLPATPCRHNNDNKLCFYPLMHPGDEVTIRLLIENIDLDEGSESSSQEPKWRSICVFNATLPDTGKYLFSLPKTVVSPPSSSIFNSTTGVTCNVTIPEFLRQRSTQVKPLEAKFLIQKKEESEDPTRPVVLSVPFTMTQTRLVTSSSNNQQQQQHTKKKIKKKEVISYLKYNVRQPIVLRFVAENRPYGPSLPIMRNDGFLYQSPQQSHHRTINNRPLFFVPYFYVDDMGLLSYQRRVIGPSNSTQKNKQTTNATTTTNIIGDQTKNASAREQYPPPVSLSIQISSLSPMRHVIQKQVTQALDVAEDSLQLKGTIELDEIRYFLRDERLYRFFLSQIISWAHIWLEYMAFCNEVMFYRKKTNSVGISLSSLVTSMVCSLIIFLYLLDGGGTSWIVLASTLTSTLVAAWKVWKFLEPKWTWNKFPRIIHFSKRVQKRDNNDKTENENNNSGDRLYQLELETAKYDATAIRYLGYVLYPIVIVWSLYALAYESYPSYYSWLISNLANAVYTFGFITLCPQLYVNYKLQSVAHMPWKVYVYKIFTTFVDDVFAFLVDMPWKHRLMTLRDDVVFIMFLYQAYIYRVDKSRPNEYGHVYQDENDDKEKETKTVIGAVHEKID